MITIHESHYLIWRITFLNQRWSYDSVRHAASDNNAALKLADVFFHEYINLSIQTLLSAKIIDACFINMSQAISLVFI